MLDQVDLQILELLRENSRMSWKDIGLLIARLSSTQELNALLKRILEYGNYRLSLSIEKVKSV